MSEKHIKSAVYELVVEKRRFDKSLILSAVSRRRGIVPATDPYQYYKLILPHFPMAPIDLELGIVDARPDRDLAEIDPTQALGAAWSIQWFDSEGKVRDRRQAQRDISTLNALAESGDMVQIALVAVISPIDLCIVFEGKNRFEAARQAGCPGVVAKSEILEAPSPRDLLLRPLNGGGFALEALQGGSSAQARAIAPLMGVASMELLAAYGVRTGRTIGGNDEMLLRSQAAEWHRCLVSSMLG